MKHLNTYIQYIKEAMTTDIDGLLDEINDKKVDFYKLNLSNDDYINKSIEYLYDDGIFNEQLFKDELKKGDIDSTTEIENFLRKGINMKFFFLYSRNNTILDDPEYLLLQYYKDDKLHPIEIYSIKGDINKFYNKLTAKEIQLTYNNISYIYVTSNSGNNWILQNSDKSDDNYKKDLETENIKTLIRNGAKLKIIK